jgi:dihydroneopterin aldolase
MPADVLRLRNLRFFAYHGLHTEENRLGQAFEVDLELRGDFAAAALADDPALTIDYVQVCRVVEEVVTQRRFKLVEALAENIAGAVGAAFAPVELTVRVRKPHPPVPLTFEGVEVELHRRYA